MKKMKKVELSVLSRDLNTVLEFLGRRGLFQLIEDEPAAASADDISSGRIRDILDKLALAAAWLGVILPSDPMEESRLPGEAEEGLAQTITGAVSSLGSRENEKLEEKRKVDETLNEAKAFSSLNASFSDLDQLSYLTLRVGRLDPRWQDELKAKLSDRAVVVPLGPDGRFLAAASRKGRFALDTELKKMNFAPIVIPEGYKGIPSELLSGLEERLSVVQRELEDIAAQKEKLREEYENSLKSLASSYLMAEVAEKFKTRLQATRNVFFLSGWVPADMIKILVEELEALTQDRVAIRTYDPEELTNVMQGTEKVPVSMEHGAFVKGFEKLVFSYGAPLYGTVDPTPLVAFFFTILFGVMFGDLGQGIVLLLLGFITGKRGPAFLSKFRHFSVPLIAVGISSMVMGFLTGSFFTNEIILAGPTRVITGFLTGRPVDRILTLMPIPEKGGSVVKLFYFFGFTAALGALLNSAGLIVNTINKLYLKKYEEALLDKTGLAGLLLFWYAIFIALRFIASLVRPEIYIFSFRWFDTAGLAIPLAGIFLGPGLWRLISGERPVFKEGFMVFVMKGFVEILETISSNIYGTVSFLRVGAFAFSHAVLSFTVFWFAEKVSAAGAVFSAAAGGFILVIGNVIIILLEGLIVAIQVVRLQYYEFFSKFFTETGVEFTPFRFNKFQ